MSILTDPPSQRFSIQMFHLCGTQELNTASGYIYIIDSHVAGVDRVKKSIRDALFRNGVNLCLHRFMVKYHELRR